MRGADKILDSKLNNMMSSGFALFYNLSALAGPIIGGYIYNNVDFVQTLIYHIYLQGIIVIIFIIFNCGISVLKKDKANKKIIIKLNKISRIIKKQD